MSFHIKSIYDEFSRNKLKMFTHFNNIKQTKENRGCADVYIKFQKLLTATDPACTQLLLYNACWI